jgi:hypothetical protein
VAVDGHEMMIVTEMMMIIIISKHQTISHNIIIIIIIIIIINPSAHLSKSGSVSQRARKWPWMGTRQVKHLVRQRGGSPGGSRRCIRKASVVCANFPWSVCGGEGRLRAMLMR